MQLSVYQRLDIPHGYRDILKTRDKNLILIPAVRKLKEGRIVQHTQFESTALEEIFSFLLQRLKNQQRKSNEKKVTRQQVFEDRGINSGTLLLKKEEEK